MMARFDLFGYETVVAKLRRGARAAAYGNPLYALTLKSRTPEALSVSPPDPWPGSSERGYAMLRGEYLFDGQRIVLEQPVWEPLDASDGWLAAWHGFDWLRDLRALGGDAARRLARGLVASWIEHYPGWNSLAWQPDILGRRVAAWVGFHDFFCASAEDMFRATMFDSLAKQVRHLARDVGTELQGEKLLAALKGLIVGALALPDEESRYTQGLRLLERELEQGILEDGGLIERSPTIQALGVRHLVDIRAVMLAARRPVPDALNDAILRSATALRFFRHGDGGLGLFHDSQEGEPVVLDAVLSAAESRGRAPKSLPVLGFDRMQMGRSLVMFDTAAPPPVGVDSHAHAAPLAFEMSVGRNRMIVNCGAYRGTSPQWRNALRATAAHSGVTIGDMSVPMGKRSRKQGHVTHIREETDTAILITAEHDFYVPTLGVEHRRRLYLHDGGDELRGEDILIGPAGLEAAIRFHVHPEVDISLVGAGGQALLRLGDGAGWRFRCSFAEGVNGRVELADSVYFGQNGQRRTHQLVLTARTIQGLSTVKWAFTREKPRQRMSFEEPSLF